MGLQSPVQIRVVLKNCGTGAGGFQPGNTCGAEDGDGPTPRGSTEPSRVLFEVAPDPNDKFLAGRWNSLPNQEREAVSREVSQAILPRVFKAAGVRAEVRDQYGGYLDDSNPSFAAVVDAGIPAERLLAVAKLTGFALAQDSMMVVSEREFAGGDKVGAITVKLPEGLSLADTHAVYKTLRTIDDGVIQGHTTVGGEMLILDFGGDTGALAEKVDAALGGKYTVALGTAYAAFINKGEYDYADSSRIAELADGGKDASDLRAEAGRLIDEGLKRRGKSVREGRARRATTYRIKVAGRISPH